MRRLGRVAAHVRPVAEAYHTPAGLPGSQEPVAAIPDDERWRLYAGTGSARPKEIVKCLGSVGSAAAIAAFRSSGFLVVENAFSPQQVAGAVAGITAIARRENPFFAHRMDNPDPEIETKDDEVAPSLYENRESMVYHEQAPAAGGEAETGPTRADKRPIRKLNGFVAFDERLAALADGAAEATAALLRGEAMLFQDMALLKPAAGAEKPWHQDHAYFNAELDTPIVGCWIALDAATLDNGCMRVLRGGHRQQGKPSALPHYLRRDWQICDTTALTFPPSQVVNLPLASGDLILFDGLLPHGTPSNDSAQQRQSYCELRLKWPIFQSKTVLKMRPFQSKFAFVHK